MDAKYSNTNIILVFILTFAFFHGVMPVYQKLFIVLVPSTGKNKQFWRIINRGQLKFMYL